MNRRLVTRSLLTVAAALLAAAYAEGTSVPGESVPVTSATTSTTDERVGASIVLRPDGLGPYDFMTPRSEVETGLTKELGPPERLPRSMVVSCGSAGCERAEVLSWPDAGLLVAFVGRQVGGTAVLEPVMTSWTVTVGPWESGKISAPTNVFDPELVPTRLTTAEGVGLGTTAAELKSAMASTEFLGWNDGTFVPNGFFVPGDTGEAGLVGDLDWNVVADLQESLRASGADIKVDGVADVSTTAALVEYRDRSGQQAWRDVMTALGVTEPHPDSRVVRLSGGMWWWEFACGGELEVFGMPDQC